MLESDKQIFHCGSWSLKATNRFQNRTVVRSSLGISPVLRFRVSLQHQGRTFKTVSKCVLKQRPPGKLTRFRVSSSSSFLTPIDPQFWGKGTSMSHTTASRRAFYPALNGLRAIAALLVFVQHYFFAVPARLGQVTSYCWIGVDIFFVLSGFLITGILYDSCHGAGSLRAFYWHRAMRIYPLFYGVLAAVFLAGSMHGVHWHWAQLLYPLNLGNHARFLLYPPTSIGIDTVIFFSRPSNHGVPVFLGHLWTLCVEEQFYLIWPFVVFALRSRIKLIRFCLVLIAIEPAVRYLGAAYLPQPLVQAQVIYSTLPFRCDALAFGALLALLQRGPRWASFLQQRRLLLLGGTVAIMLPALVETLQGHDTLPFRDPIGAAFWFSSVDLGAAALVAALTDSRSHVTRLLSIKWLVGLGTISYGFYMFHDIPKSLYHALALWIAPTHTMAVLFVIGLFGTTMLALGSWHFYESFFLRYKHRFDPELESSSVLAPEQTANLPLEDAT